MTRDRSNDPPKSAADLMAELQRDPDFVRRARERTQQQDEHQTSYRRAIQPVLEELSAGGVWVTDLRELRTRDATEYRGAVPVLLRWLNRVTDVAVKQDIVRTLSVPYAAPAAARPFVEEFRRATTGGLRWAVANGLAVVADDGVFKDVAGLVTDARYGKAREMLAVALGNMQPPGAVDVLINLLRDEDVAGHAAIALGKLRAFAALEPLKTLAPHRQEWVREEAKKAIAAIEGRR